MARPGRNVLFYGEIAPNQFERIGFSDNLDIAESAEQITASHKDSNQQVVETGNITSVYTISGLESPSDVGQAKLLTIFRSKQTVLLEFHDTGEALWRVRARVTGYNRGYPVSGFATYNVTLAAVEEPYQV